jgi:type II secretory pathway pseudopilin PulG
MSSIENSLKKIIINGIILLVERCFMYVRRIKMNRKGFTLVELLGTFVILGIVIGITIVSVSNIFDSAKNKTEDVFVGTIRDALEIYLTSSNARRLSYSEKPGCVVTKTHGNVKMYKATVNFDSVINSEYKPITQADLVNPSNEDVPCSNASDIVVNVYRDADYVYYYSVDKAQFNCLIGTGNIDNLPSGYSDSCR